MKFLPYGDSAILINFEQKIDEKINAQVINLHRALQISSIETITYLIPAYCSLTIGYDPYKITFDLLRNQIQRIIDQTEVDSSQKQKRVLKIPVCYEPPYALDFEDVESHTQLSTSSIISIHTSTLFRVYMLGFVAGFSYMGTLPELIQCPRKQVPRLKTPVGSVGLAGQQTGIYPTEAPGGWQIIGRTPLKVFNHQNENPSLLQPGDLVRFHAITPEAFESIQGSQSLGTYKLQILNE